MFAAWSAVYMVMYLIEKYKTFQSQALFSELTFTVDIAVRNMLSINIVWGTWSKDNAKYFKLDEDKKQQIHFRDYAAIIKHNKPIRMLVIVAYLTNSHRWYMVIQYVL